MTKTEIAKRAIIGTTISRTAHIDIMEIMRTLKLSTDEAVELHAMVRTEWTKANGADWDSDVTHLLRLAKEVVNQYARDPRMR